MNYTLEEIVGFTFLVFTALMIDLRSHRGGNPISFANAAGWSCFWVILACLFGGYVQRFHGNDSAALFFSGCLLEKSLSVDNLFLFMAVFASFGVKDGLQHKVLHWGIIGAVVLRLLFISAGTALFILGEWVMIPFGLFVLYSAYVMCGDAGEEDEARVDYTKHWAVRAAKTVFPVCPRMVRGQFFTSNGYATPLFLCLIVIEVADIMFAFDSVPAVISITKDPFLVYTSNIFAILGLRSMYFMLAAAKRYLRFLDLAVIAVLGFIGMKMILGATTHLHGIRSTTPNESLVVVAGLLSSGILASIIWPSKQEKE